MKYAGSVYRFLEENGFLPKLFTVLKSGYTANRLIRDAGAGVIVGIIALPLSIALAIASGVSPVQGLYTAIIAGFIISFFGGSLVQIGGPTGAFVIIVYGIMEKHGYEGLAAATVMAGIILIIMGVFKLGNIIKYIPYPVTTGFTSGIAVTLFTTQVKDFFGLSVHSLPSEFFPRMTALASSMGTISLSSVIIGTSAIAIIVIWPKFNKRIPGTLPAILATTLAAYFLKMDVETIGSRFGTISSSLPALNLSSFSHVKYDELIMPAVTIALLAGIESLLSAVVADGMINGKHRSNMELIAQGMANIASPLFGGIPATGAIARTAANVKNGGRSPVAGIVHALTLLSVMLLFMPYASYIPMSALAAVLIMVAYNMGEWEEFREIRKAPKSDAAVFLAVFILTVITDLVVAIEIGMILASFLFIKRMSDVTDIKAVSEGENGYADIEGSLFPYNKKILEKVIIYEIAGAFFFGAADKFLEISKQIYKNPKVLILRMGKVPAMDATGFHALEMIYDTCKRMNIRMIVSEVQKQPMSIMEKALFTEQIGSENIVQSIDEAMEKAAESINMQS